MAFTIMTLMAQPGPELFYDPKFRLMVETHINILRNHFVTREDIPANHYYQYEGDFYGFLVGRSIPAHLHWVYMRVNGMTNPNQFAKDLRNYYTGMVKPTLLIPNDGVLSDIQRMYVSLKNK
ncbi:hypothetical protein PHABIO_107 [Pseudomonas phage Phabio]|uniref:Uncharacterized protein n=1 Tax=Pseudomonas phage Phabio TaxID=2006668 RepID=A0A1Y0SZT6_9CAUD|nr:hypothetical protein MZD05_gp107 [Pseudomonas phage Phabio]ARV76738.1 hypothetical protein PHABIO_107 [Pseudomonas phage Phabio]